MGKKDQNQKEKERVEAVLELLRKQAPLTLKQEKFCNNGCVERFLKTKGNSVKKATKQLRTCLSWRESIDTDHLTADEFSAELAEGLAYVAGHDEESRPVMIFRIKQDYQKFHSQKLFTRLMVFTLEVAIQTMPRNIEQFVILFDATGKVLTVYQQHVDDLVVEVVKMVGLYLCRAITGHYPSSGFFRSASAFMNILLATLKITAEYYPGRLHKAFIIDPPSLFSYLWKGVRPFVELSPVTVVVSSLDFNDFTSYPRASSLRFDPSSIPSTAKIGSCSSSRFSFTVSHHFDSLKPWYLTLTDTPGSKVGPTSIAPSSMGPALVSPLNARSYSFASPVARTPRGNINGVRKGFFPSTPLPEKTQKMDFTNINHPRTPRPSFLRSPAVFFKRECHVSSADKSRDSFVPFLKFYRWPYDEMTYRSKMRPPLGGLISIVSPQLRRRHMSVSQRF